METVEITVGEFIDNIEKNGFPQTTGHLWRVENEELGFKEPSVPNAKILSACAFGQGLINSGLIRAIYFDEAEDTFTEDFYAIVWRLNDLDELPIPHIVSSLRETYADMLDKKLKFLPFDYSPFI